MDVSHFPRPRRHQERWTRSRAYLPLQSGEIVALNRETGAPSGPFPLKATCDTSRRRWSPVCQPVPGEFQAMRRRAGELGWTVSLDAESLGAPVLQGDLILLLVKPDQLRALRASDGSEIWRRTIGAEGSSTTLATDTSGIVVGKRQSPEEICLERRSADLGTAI